jgi:menaquinone-dependent protoporphyrinogen oxidase
MTGVGAPGTRPPDGWEKRMQVLVSAASRHGSTIEVAATIGSVLTAAGLSVHVLAPREVASVDGFDAAVIGSGIYLGRWLDPARKVLLRNRAGLERIPVWLFSSGPVGDPPQPADEPAEARRLVGLVGAREHRTFPGQVEWRRLGLGEKAMVTVVRAPEGDFRPWDEIEGWAREIAAALEATTATR